MNTLLPTVDDLHELGDALNETDVAVLNLAASQGLPGRLLDRTPAAAYFPLNFRLAKRCNAGLMYAFTAGLLRPSFKMMPTHSSPTNA